MIPTVQPSPIPETKLAWVAPSLEVCAMDQAEVQTGMGGDSYQSS